MIEDDALSVEPGKDEETAITGGELPGVDEFRAHFCGQRLAPLTALMTLVRMVLDNNTNPCPVGRELPQLAIFPRMGQDSSTTAFLH